jgi:hypothetical protein
VQVALVLGLGVRERAGRRLQAGGLERLKDRIEHDLIDAPAADPLTGVSRAGFVCGARAGVRGQLSRQAAHAWM